MKKTLIVMGAGASVDCLSQSIMEAIYSSNPKSEEQSYIGKAAKQTLRYLPPLTKNLVLSLQEHGAGCAQLLENVDAEQRRQGAKFDFESTLREIHEEYADEFQLEFDQLRFAIRNRMSMADKIGTKYGTLYTNFFGRLRGSAFGRDREFVILNMNYDRLAEMALSDRQGFEKLPDYIGACSKFKLLHPHGNCGWFLGNHDHQMEDRNGAIKYRAGKKIIQKHVEQRENHDSQAIAILDDEFIDHGEPALALPMSGDDKGKTVWPTTHYDYFLNCLPEIDSIIIIGWRGADKHIVDLVSSGLGRVNETHLVGFGDTEQVAENLASWNIQNSRVELVNVGFRKYLYDASGPFSDLISLERH